MANNFTITLKNDTNDQGAGSKVGGAGGVQNTSSSQGQSTQSGGGFSGKINTDVLVSKAKGLVSVAAIASVADRIISYNNSLIEVRTGSRELAERTSYQYNVAKTLVSGAAGGAALGGMVMPGIGHAVGALVGLVTSGISHAINVELQQNTINENARLEKTQRYLTTQRVTVSGSRYMNASQM